MTGASELRVALLGAGFMRRLHSIAYAIRKRGRMHPMWDWIIDIRAAVSFLEQRRTSRPIGSACSG
jgi:hypothetical protein